MREGLLSRVSFLILTGLAVGVTLHAVRYYGVALHRWFDVDPRIRSMIERNPIGALTHVLVAPIALLLGPIQFSGRLRVRHPRVHRWAGRAYVASCMIGGGAGFATAFHATGGPVAGFGFGTLAVLWIGTTLWAWRAALTRDIALHRLMMRFSYALTFGAVTLRLQIPIGFALGYASYSAMSVWLAYTAWVRNVFAVGLYSLWRTRWHGSTALRP